MYRKIKHNGFASSLVEYSLIISIYSIFLKLILTVSCTSSSGLQLTNLLVLHRPLFFVHTLVLSLKLLLLIHSSGCYFFQYHDKSNGFVVI